MAWIISYVYNRSSLCLHLAEIIFYIKIDLKLIAYKQWLKITINWSDITLTHCSGIYQTLTCLNYCILFLFSKIHHCAFFSGIWLWLLFRKAFYNGPGNGRLYVIEQWMDFHSIPQLLLTVEDARLSFDLLQQMFTYTFKNLMGKSLIRPHMFYCMPITIL